MNFKSISPLVTPPQKQPNHTQVAAASIGLVEMADTNGVPIWVTPSTAARWRRRGAPTITIEVDEVDDDDWLTVTEAAREHTSDVDGMTFEVSKGRVSRAASAGDIVTNGKTGKSRRLEPNSVAAWRLYEREKHLNDLE